MSFQTKYIDYHNVTGFLPHSGHSYLLNGAPQSTTVQQRSKTSFRSMDNPIWNIRKSEKLLGKRGVKVFSRLDLGNHLFRKEHLLRVPFRSSAYNKVIKPFQTFEYSGAVCIGSNMSNLNLIAMQNLSLPSFEDSDVSLWGRGASVIASTLPNKEQMNIAVSLAELRREGLPSFMSLREIFKNPGGAYLNVTFGWEPIIRDVQKLCSVLSQTKDLIQKFEDMRGKEYRRRRNVLQEESTDSYLYNVLTPAYPPVPTLFTGASSAVARPTVVRKYSDHIWFSGCYRVATLDDSTLLGQITDWESKANHLLGIRITPEVLYNLTAWTWLLDWFVTVGDVVTNYSHLGRDGVALKYGYLMRTTKVEAEITLPNVFWRGLEVTDTVILTRQSRVRATPYGFGLTAADLNPKQWSILAALGLSKAQGVLW